MFINSVCVREDEVKMGNSLVTLEEDKDLQVHAYLSVYDYAIPVIGLFIILVNFCVVLSSGLIIKKGVEPRYTYLFLGNLAMADMVTGICVLFGQFFPKQNRTHTICTFQMGLIVSSLLSSVFSVGLLAVDRFLYIVYGIKYCQWTNIRRVRIILALTWIWAMFIGFLPLMGWYGDTQNGRVCWLLTVAPAPLIILTVTMGVIPIIIVFSLYTIILYHAITNINKIHDTVIAITTISDKLEARENLRKFKGTVEQPIKKSVPRRKFSNSQIPNKWKAIKIVLFTTTSFMVTWMPFFVACIVYVWNQCDFDDPNFCKTLRLVIASPLTILGITNSLINPLIYAWWHNGFRTFVITRIKMCFRFIHHES